jgi:putative oxidoreductase
MRLALRLQAGVVFVAFGAGKFINHGSELASFKSYGLPVPEVFVVVIGLIEVIGGVLLIVGRLVRPTALVLAGNMVGAIVVSGLAKGEIISLTLAPIELIAMLVLLLSQRRAKPSLTRRRTAGTATASDSPSASQPATMYGKRS